MVSIHKSNNSYFEACSEDVERLLYCLVEQLERKDELIPLPRYLELVRARVFKFLTNALFYNVNYKDLGHLNVSHLTNFPIYPLEKPGGDIYPFFRHFFCNTLYINGGYINYCVRTIIRGDEYPFITARDFDLLLLYLALTRKVRLSVNLCRSYLFKGGYDIFSDLYKYFAFKIPKPSGAITKLKNNRWTRETYYWSLESPCDLNKFILTVGLRYCGGNIAYWSAEKIQAISKFPYSYTNYIDLKEVEAFHVLRFGGRYLINDGEYGLIYSNIDSCPYAYVWDRLGLKRFDNACSFLRFYGENINKIQWMISDQRQSYTIL